MYVAICLGMYVCSYVAMYICMNVCIYDLNLLLCQVEAWIWWCLSWIWGASAKVRGAPKKQNVKTGSILFTGASHRGQQEAKNIFRNF